MKTDPEDRVSDEDPFEVVKRMDQRNIEVINSHIDLANKLVNEIDDKLFSKEGLTIIELKKQKQIALQYKRILVKIKTDPQYKVFLHLSSNKEIENILLKKLPESLSASINGLDNQVKIIESRIELRENEEKKGPEQIDDIENESAILKLFEESGICFEKEQDAESFFKIRCNKEMESDTSFEIKFFAECEKRRIGGTMLSVKNQINTPERDGTYIQARQYIEYLNRVIRGQTGKDVLIAIDKLPSNYTYFQLGEIFDNLVSRKIALKEDKTNFLSLFIDPIDLVYGNKTTSQSVKGLVCWNETVRGAKAGLFDLVERITRNKYSASQLKEYFKVKGSLHDNWRDKYGCKTRLIDKVLSGIMIKK